MSGGAGGMGIASNYMKQIDRQIRNAARTRRDNVFIRRQVRKSFQSEEEATTHVNFQCYYLCPKCGYLALGSRSPCEACGETTLLDLSENSTAHTLQAVEEQERATVPKWVKRVAFGICTSLFFASTIPAFGLRPEFFGVSILSFIVLIPLYFVSLKPLSVFLFRFKNTSPKRWHLPLPLVPTKWVRQKKKEPPTSKGTVVGEPSLVAPFSGKPCVGFKAMILFDVKGDTRPPQWVSTEVYSTRFKIDGIPLNTNEVMIDLPVHPVEPSRLCKGFNAKAYLRARGLFAEDGQFLFYETLIEPGQTLSAYLAPGLKTQMVAA